MEHFPEQLHDELEAYPLRLNVAALPERRFFKMIRTLTVLVVLASALMICLAVFLNYQITHLNVTLLKNNRWQFYQIDPQEKKLHTLENAEIRLNPLVLMIESKLRDYLMWRNSTAGSEQQISANFTSGGRIYQFSSTKVFDRFASVDKRNLPQRDTDIVREAHIYDLRLLYPRFPYLWMAYIEVFDMPATEDYVGVCLCSDNSKQCLDCKKQKSVNRERYKIWIRTTFGRPQKCIVQDQDPILKDQDAGLCLNPLGISVDEYNPTIVPIHDDETYWNLPPALRTGL